MKRKILISISAITGSLAIVGSGFASWYFSEDTLQLDQNVSTHVTNLVDGIGTLTDNNKDQKIYIVLDQGGYANKDDATKGIKFVDVSSGTISDSNLGTAVDSLSATYTLSAGGVNDLLNTGYGHISYAIQLILNSEASNYLKFVSDYENLIEGPTGGTKWVSDDHIIYMGTIDFEKDVAVDQTFKFPTATVSEVNNMLVYKSKPSDKTKYDAMKSALNGQDILSVQYTITIY